MTKELLFNGSGYVDPTAHDALRKISIGRGKNVFNRGEIYELTVGNSDEIRYAIIVSAQDRAEDRAQSVVIIGENGFGENCVQINCQGIKFANCNRTSYAFEDRIGNFVRSATQEEMELIDAGIARSLGLNASRIQERKRVAVKEDSPALDLTTEEMDDLADFIEQQFLESIRRDHEIDNLHYVANICSAYRKIYETVRK